MSAESGLWLIGVKADEFARTGEAQFLYQLRNRFRGRENIRDGIGFPVRQVTKQDDIASLQKQHGKQFEAFFYLGEPLITAAQKSRIVVHRLQLVFGQAAGEVVAVIYLQGAD